MSNLQRCVPLDQRGGVLGLAPGGFTDDRRGQMTLLEQRQQRCVGRAERCIRKGQMALLAALGVGDAGEMGVELLCPFIPQPGLQRVQQGGVVD